MGLTYANIELQNAEDEGLLWTDYEFEIKK
jgi:hypothetical protein